MQETLLVDRVAACQNASNASRKFRACRPFKRAVARCGSHKNTPIPLLTDFQFTSLPASSTLSSLLMSSLAAPTLHILRGSLRSYPANGHVAFVPQVRKLVFEYCDYWPSSAHTRTFLSKHVEQLARDNPHVEIVVRQRQHKQPIVRGFYSEFLISFVAKTVLKAPSAQ